MPEFSKYSNESQADFVKRMAGKGIGLLVGSKVGGALKMGRAARFLKKKGK